jgi:hypothetical protein
MSTKFCYEFFAEKSDVFTKGRLNLSIPKYKRSNGPLIYSAAYVIGSIKPHFYL